MSEVCHNVKIEPGLQPVTGEQFEHRTANREDGARLDIVAQNFWGRVLMLGFLTHTHLNSTQTQCYRKNELEKKRCYALGR